MGTPEVRELALSTAAHARGLADCKETVQDQAVAAATPIIEVHHSKAHVTREAAIDSVDGK